MKVEEVFRLKDRGQVAIVTWDADLLPKASAATLRRAADGSTWTITGVDRWLVYKTSWKGVQIGLLLAMDSTVIKGDEVEVVL